jgi:uncharacterized protein
MRVMTALLATAIVLSAAYAGEPQEVRGFPDLERRAVEIWSDGTRLAGDVTYPKDTPEGEKLPAIVLCHGWGGTKAHLNAQIGPQFAQAGFIVLTFDYRGWGESDSRLVVMDEMPEPDEEGYVTVKALAVRQLVDPLDQQEDIDAAISFIEGEPMADPNRIGIWGSSFGGGHVIYRAAIDDRVKCVVAQVGAMDQMGGVDVEAMNKERTARARGEVMPVPLDAEKPAGLIGTPYYERFARFSPVDYAGKIDVPVLIIDAEEEHYFDIKEHGGKVYDIIKDQTTAKYVVFEDTEHYDVYRGEKLQETMALEIPWFQEHLK